MCDLFQQSKWLYFDDNSKQWNYLFSHLLRRLMQHWSLSNHAQTKTHLILTDPGEQVITNSGSSELYLKFYSGPESSQKSKMCMDNMENNANTHILHFPAEDINDIHSTATSFVICN